MQELKIKGHVVQYQRDAHDLGKWPPGGPKRRILDEDGKQKYDEDGRALIERLPSTPSCLMLHPGGSVVWVPLACGSGRKQQNDPYALTIGKEKMQKGFLPVENCPKSFGLQDKLTQGFPEDLLEAAPCRRGHKLDKDGNTRPISETNPCICIVTERALRNGISTKRTDALNKRYRNQAALDIAARDSEASALKAAVTSAAETTALKGELAELKASMAELVAASKGKKK